jgi:4-hydroxybenzoate polyprenyltransferase
MAVIPFCYIITTQPSFEEEIENYKGHFAVIFAHASFFTLLLLIREMIKDLENKGDLANDYKTIPIVYGEMVSKKITALTASLTIFLCVLIEIMM